MSHVTTEVAIIGSGILIGLLIFTGLYVMGFLNPYTMPISEVTLYQEKCDILCDLQSGTVRNFHVSEYYAYCSCCFDLIEENLTAQRMCENYYIDSQDTEEKFIWQLGTGG